VLAALLPDPVAPVAPVAAWQQHPARTARRSRLLAPGVWVTRTAFWAPAAAVLDANRDLPWAEGAGRVVALAVTPPGWHALALCRTVDTPFFGVKDDRLGMTRGEVLRAQRVCADCLVVPDCLGWALGHNEMHGVWGGTSASQREQMAREHRAGRGIEIIVKEWCTQWPTPG
jgi:WhiB family redox-sensing transcriptional regulator